MQETYEKQHGGTDPDAYLAEMIRQYGGLVRHICRNALPGRPEDVDECVSDAFVALWRKAKDGGADAIDVKSYLCGIARNKAIDRYRRIKAQPAALPLDDAETGGTPPAALSEPDFAELLAKDDEAAILAEAVDGLPSPSREVFVLRYGYLERVKAIADKLGLTEKAVENMLYRGKRSLRRKLSGSGLSREAPPATPAENRSEDMTQKENYEVIIYG